MKTRQDHVAVLVTTPNLRVARVVARTALKVRAAACANLIPGLESHYWWQGKLERAPEILVVFKTVRSRLPALWEAVVASHPYDTPEFVVVPLVGGSRRYFDWIDAEVGARRTEGV